MGTDCSGAEAPIWSLRSMCIPHIHAFSCDVSPAVRKFIAACSPPVGPIFPDMLKRDIPSIPAHSVYVCGFPCKPFSLLRRHSTKLMREPTAKPFFATVKVIREHLPMVAILENVEGIKSVMKYVVNYFVNLLWYYVLVIPINSVELGEPVRRPRVYFVLIRRDVALVRNRADLESFAEAMLAAARAPHADTIAQRMLPTSHPAVRDYCSKLTRRRGVSEREKGRPKWIKHNEDFTAAHGLSSGSSSGLASGIEGLQLPRLRTAWQLLSNVHTSPNLVADVSQNVHRASVCVDGSAPTITPGGIIAVKKGGRVLVPVEKLLVHNFPLHKMSVPQDTSDKEMESLGGNTMHLAAVGCALLIGMGAINWSASAARVGQKPCGPAPPRESAIYIAGAAAQDPSKKRRLSIGKSIKAKRRK